MVTEADLKNLTVVKLKDLLKARNLPLSGKKQILIDRLLLHQNNNGQLELPTPSDRTTRDKTSSTFEEPKIKWKKSEAKRLLYNDIRDGKIPLVAKDENKQFTLPRTADIYQMRPEFRRYDPAKFSARLASVRKTLRENNAREIEDRLAFQKFVGSNPVSRLSHKGYIQWQGSESQKQALKDIQAGLVQQLGYAELHATRPVYYYYFDLKTF